MTLMNTYLDLNLSLAKFLARAEGKGYAYGFYPNTRMKNIRGCDFRYAVLELADFEGAVGGFSALRPSMVILSILIAFGIASSIYSTTAEFLDLSIGGIALFLVVFLTFSSLLCKTLLYLLYLDVRPKKECRFYLPRHLVGIPVAFLPPALVLAIQQFLVQKPWQEMMTGFEKFDFWIVTVVIGMILGVLVWRGFSDLFLFKTSFDHAVLTRANFRGADLQNCSFRFADLSQADFTGANIQGVDFKGAKTETAKGLGESL